MNRHDYTYEEPQEAGSLLPKGEYPFTVIEVFDWEESKAGNEYLPIKVEIDGGDRGTGTAYENLVFADSAKWKIDGFLKSIHGGVIQPGKKIDFNDPAWLQGRSGTCLVEPKPVKGKDYEANNIVRFTYPKSELDGRSVSTPSSTPAPAPAADESDDIPF